MKSDYEDLQEARQENEQLKKQIADMSSPPLATIGIPSTYDKTERLERYLFMLFESQKVGHDVHQEIAEALEEYRHALGSNE